MPCRYEREPAQEIDTFRTVMRFVSAQILMGKYRLMRLFMIFQQAGSFLRQMGLSSLRLVPARWGTVGFNLAEVEEGESEACPGRQDRKYYLDQCGRLADRSD